MLTIRRADERGITEIDWLKSWHTFSFGDYHDAAHMGFRALRVINDDIIGGGGGFGTHPHRNMEIITIMLEGELTHRDSLGHQQSLKPGEVQVMSAGSGIRHSEFNASKTAPAHLIQTWITPRSLGITPRYEQREFPRERRLNTITPVASGRRDVGDIAPGAIEIHQDASLSLLAIQGGKTATRAIAPGRAVWLHVARGRVTTGGEALSTGDAIGVDGLPELSVLGQMESDVLIFDLA
ncbi:MAG: pirin family protein [Phycisphaerales bacterium]|nr:pirin family protein [Phycisphaerales bacterium]